MFWNHCSESQNLGNTSLQVCLDAFLFSKIVHINLQTTLRFHFCSKAWDLFNQGFSARQIMEEPKSEGVGTQRNVLTVKFPPSKSYRY